MPFISVNDIEVIKKTASGPISGSVFEAIWTKPDGEKVGLNAIIIFCHSLHTFKLLVNTRKVKEHISPTNSNCL